MEFKFSINVVKQIWVLNKFSPTFLIKEVIQEFTKIAARSIKSRRKTDAMLGFLLGTNIITILGIVAMYFLK